MPAFEGAVALGYRYVETDAHVTADGICLAFHDDRLDRVTDRVGVIADLPYAEVRQARVDGREPIPLLEDLIAAFPDVRVNIDPKHDAAVDALVTVIERTGAIDRVCVGSFSEGRLHRFRRIAGPAVATSAGPFGIAAGIVASRLGFGPSPRGAVLQVPMRTRFAGRMVEVVTPAFIQRAHEWGKQVHVWTIDDEAMMNQLIDWGVDGLVSDRIDLLKKVCQVRGLWPSS